jgi:hypothetical protein
MTITEKDIHDRARKLWENEGGICLSYMVSTLAKGFDAFQRTVHTADLYDLAEQAFELCSPVQDWEEALIQDGWEQYRDKYGAECWRKTEDGKELTWAGSAEDTAREFADIEPYDREVYEHWSVSNWLAEKLIEKGEKVDTDFAGLNVWARTTTGQLIYADSVMEAIARDMLTPAKAED